MLTPKQPKPPKKTVIFRPPAGLIEEVDAEAAALGLSRNEAMTQLLRYALERHKKRGTKR